MEERLSWVADVSKTGSSDSDQDLKYQSIYHDVSHVKLRRSDMASAGTEISPLSRGARCPIPVAESSILTRLLHVSHG